MSSLDDAILRALTDVESQAREIRANGERRARSQAIDRAEHLLETLATLERGFACFLGNSAEPLNRMRRNLLDGLLSVGSGDVTGAVQAIDDAVTNARELTAG